ncbi:ABC transporter ATP-binding protein [Azospirillum griseum]|uniref:sn-glycerol-3-phosphate ABC transporter ATP-binding protein UgpC n=1 Tax=Azospirillum griseum TaxID=2496639 RepID=A0A3S0K903_9PROT|nr:sn-glycerol-3-phosphate ABC transporter ATP-binding protein UgpC [Azospirillum griseum]RTR17096.1 sn-glycerol-3-phosphate ABC transporter ATP-binding protein UgpC [Azospirillum griseum]
MAEICLRGVRKVFGGVSVIKGVDLTIADGAFCVFVGPSGCGKSTLLRLIAGLEDINDGSLSIGGADMTRVDPSDRGVAMVFQSYALYPHMTVRDNIGFGLKMTGHPASLIEERTRNAARMLRLDPLLDRKPAQLSGGQRQRVAIGRAIVREPEVFLFDEPLSNLDAALRVQMRTELLALHQDLKATMIYVTHDQVEAMTMADTIVVLSAGCVEQIGAPLDLYHRPRNLFVAGFIGSPTMNILPVTAASADDGRVVVTLPGGVALTLRAPDVPRASFDTGMRLGIRPEHLSATGMGDATLTGRVRLTEHLGSETLIVVTLPDGAEATVKADGLAQARPGDTLAIGVNAAACHLFDRDGLAILNGDLRS